MVASSSRGVSTLPKQAAGPSAGHVPRVALEDDKSGYRPMFTTDVTANPGRGLRDQRRGPSGQNEAGGEPPDESTTTVMTTGRCA